MMLGLAQASTATQIEAFKQSLKGMSLDAIRALFKRTNAERDAKTNERNCMLKGPYDPADIRALNVRIRELERMMGRINAELTSRGKNVIMATVPPPTRVCKGGIPKPGSVSPSRPTHARPPARPTPVIEQVAPSLYTGPAVRFDLEPFELPPASYLDAKPAEQAAVLESEISQQRQPLVQSLYSSPPVQLAPTAQANLQFESFGQPTPAAVPFPVEQETTVSKIEKKKKPWWLIAALVGAALV